MATTEDYLDSIIMQANYLRNKVKEGTIPGSVSDLVAQGINDVDSHLDDILSMIMMEEE